jgi:hypothetical protein
LFCLSGLFAYTFWRKVTMKSKSMVSMAIVIAMTAALSVSLPVTAFASDVIYQQSADGSMPGATYYSSHGDLSGMFSDDMGDMWLVSMGYDWLNEIVVTVDLTTYTGGQLQFSQYAGSDETPDSLPGSFYGHYNGDGVAISTDGANWTTIIKAHQLAAGNSVSLPAGSSLQVKLQQFNPYPQDYMNYDGGRAIWGFVITGTRVTATVPNVVGMPQSEAQSAITTAGLSVGTVSNAYSGTVSAGSVISQSPLPGSTVGMGSAVNIVVSKGPSVSVPNLVGMTQTAAQSAIASANLVVGTVTSSYSELVAAGDVISQSPVSGSTVGIGSAVNIMVSQGPSPTGEYSGGGGTLADPYQIASAADILELSAMPTDWNKHFVLMADINLAGLTFIQAPIAPSTSANWVFQGTSFTGVFNGDGHTISNLTVTATGKYYGGLFGCVGSGGQIHDLGMANANISVGHDYAGGLVGYNYGTLTSCYATGSVSGNYYVGGLVGYSCGSLTACHATATINGWSDYVGGLVGYNCSGAVVSCYATGLVASGIGSYVGGLAGGNDGTITSCYATGSVTGPGSFVGGLVGATIRPPDTTRGKVTSCYATGLVTGGGGSYVSGLAGASRIYILMPEGGIMEDLAPWLVENSFWDTQTSGRSYSCGGTGLPTAAMQTLSSFSSVGWDFSATDGDPADWMMLRPGQDYPRLAWQPVITSDIGGLYGVSEVDYAVLAAAWQAVSSSSNWNAAADLNSDGVVNSVDMLILSGNWLAGI